MALMPYLTLIHISTRLPVDAAKRVLHTNTYCDTNDWN